MVRWEPGARGRLERAAMELYDERGFDQTTVAEIARRAGLTERTFFRHYADKREVLFGGAPAFQVWILRKVVAAPASMAPIDVVAEALGSADDVFASREQSAARARVIESHADLQERELIKLLSLSAAIAAALRERGVRDPAAALTADAGLAIFRAAFQRWIAPDETRSFSRLVRDALEDLRSVAAGR